MSNFDQLLRDMIIFWERSEFKKIQLDPHYIPTDTGWDERELNKLNNYIERLKSYQ